MTFFETNTPSVNAHYEAQSQMFSDMTRNFFEAAQKIAELNMQTAKTMADEFLSSAQQMMISRDPFEMVSLTATQAQPMAEKVRAYQQHLTNIATQSQVEMVKTAESHVPKTAQTASAMADELARKATEETEKAAQRQKTAVEKMSASTQRGNTNPAGSNQANGQAGRQT